jgi:hypothetical protein
VGWLLSAGSVRDQCLRQICQLVCVLSKRCPQQQCCQSVLAPALRGQVGMHDAETSHFACSVDRMIQGPASSMHCHLLKYSTNLQSGLHAPWVYDRMLELASSGMLCFRL